MKEELREQIVSYLLENQDKFYRLAFSYVHNADAALDIVQNAIVKALEHYTSIRNTDYVKPWFYRVLVNECLTAMQKGKREYSYEPEDLQRIQDTPVEEDHQAMEIYEQVQKLPEKMKTVVVLRFYEDFSLAEIAKVTGAKLSTVKYRLYSALKQIKMTYEEGLA